MPRWFLFCACSLLLLGVPGGTAITAAQPPPPRLELSAAEQAWLAQHPIVRVRISADYPPFEFYRNDRFQGLAVDYLQEVAQALGIVFEPVVGLTWTESLAAIREPRRLDLILLITHTPGRETFLEFTRDYISFDYVIFAPKQGPHIEDLQDLAHKRVAVERSYVMAEWLPRDLPGLTLVEVDTTEQALRAVSEGRADAYVGNLAVGTYLLDQKGMVDLKVAARTPYGTDNLAMGVRKDWPELAHLIDRALAAIPAAQQQALRQKWLPVRYDTGIEVLDIVAWVLGVAALSLLWIWQLRLLVRRRTAALQAEVALRAEKEAELERSVEAIRQAHERLRLQFTHMPLAYIVWDRDFRVAEWNPAAETMFGWTAAEAMGHHPYELIVPPEVRPLVAPVMEDLLKGPEKIFIENENVRKDGKRLFCAWSNVTLFDTAGAFAGVLAMVQDVTEQRRQEQALRSQFQQISTIFDSINAVVYVADMETYQLLYLNRQGCQLFGDDWQGHTCFGTLRGGRDEPCDNCTNAQLLRDGVPQPPCLWEFRSPLNNRWYQCIDRAIPWPDGRLVRMEIAFDITELKEMERLKDEMISAVSHELRTPLTAILGYTEFMLSNPVEPKQLESFLNIVYQQTEKLSQLIDSFLNLQRLRARKKLGEFHPVPIAPLLQEVVAGFRQRAPLHRFVLECPTELPAVQGDAVQLKQVLQQLLENAVKYSPGGGRISLGARQERGLVTLWVQDEGVGIAAADLEKIFERFYRVDNSDRRPFSGTGLGLALVQEIVTAHDGRVWAESQGAQGTTIYLSLPLVPVAHELPGPTAADQGKGLPS